ncbi:MAG: hypothetical protein A2146_03735 [Actinobacteria bacterium RBG_16_67_10]|nr:MAG: hypothetical protein A2146_03735 [Actinobacteria bacterium RBG_16_67_10]
MCGRLIERPTLKAQTCSRQCSTDYQNAKRQAAKLARWEADKKPCAFCGGVIGPDRRRNTVYCSADCKKRAMDVRWRAKSPLYMREYLYGIKPAEFDALLDSQGGRCAICRTETAGGKGGWHVDHDHATGRIRGLLCHGCNIALGYFRDDPDRLRAAMAYLETVR